MNKSKSNLAFIFIYFKKDDKIIMRLGDNMLKKIKKILRIVVIVMLFVLTINVTYDIGTAFANKTPSHSVNEIQEMDRVREIAESDIQKQNSEGTPKKDTKVLRYSSIIGILILAIVMLIVIAKKEEDNNK